MSYNLFLDDERHVKDVTWVDLPPVKWEIARNYKEFVEIIEKNGLPLKVSFDNDLAEEHYNSFFNEAKYCPDYLDKFKFKDKTGYDCAKWLISYCESKNLPLPEYYIHTMNPIAKDYIKACLESYKKFYKII